MCANFAGKNTQNQKQLKLRGESMIPKSFLTPDSSGDCGFPLSKNTTAKFESSVFLTPPSTLEKESCQIQYYNLSNPPILNLDSQEQEKITNQNKCRSPLPADRIIRNFDTVHADSDTSRVDFISRLLDSGCVHITKNILRRLDSRDLCRVATVSRTWRKYIQQDRDFHVKWKSYVLEYRDLYYNEKENLGTLKVSKLQLEREPLVEISNQNIARTIKTRQQSRAEKEVENVFQKLSLPRTSELLKRCPKCTSPSRSEDKKNLCLCDFCGLEFCSKCLKDSKLHNTTDCPGLEILQSKRKTSKRTKDTIGSKTSRSRVRRL